MLERLAVGRFPRKHHLQLRDSEGHLLHEECFTREGFEGPYTILYHQRAPHTQRVMQPRHGWPLPAPSGEHRPLAKRHYRALSLARRGGGAIDARVPMLFNSDVVLGLAFPTEPDPVYFANGDADELFYIHQGRGTLRTMLGDLCFEEREYVFIPRGLLHRFIPEGLTQAWLSIECLGGLRLPRQWRNEVGQLRMDAPYCHRDFRAPSFVGPKDEGLRDLVVKKSNGFHGFTYDDSPLDVVGWDGAVYPFAFPILNFQPRAGLVHLPPSWHGTFAARGALICSFVPRVTDFHPEAVPCPYPHSSPDCDEFIFYCKGDFTSRRGMSAGSVSHHPAGIAHGPHPGAYEKSVGQKETDELAVMLDAALPLLPTAAALEVEEPGYQESFRA